MPTLSHLQLPPPKTWQDFETLCCDLWRAIWRDPNAKKHGRQGQAQHGVDVYGNPSQQNVWAGVQCKGKDSYTDKTLSEDELRAEVQKAKSFVPALSQFTVATTGTRDAHIQQAARLLSDEHRRQGLFSVDVWSWEDIVESLELYPGVVARHYPDYALTATVQQGFDQIQSTQRDVLKHQADSTEEIKSHVTLAVSQVEQRVVSLPGSILDALTSVHDSAIELAREYLNTNKPAQALDYLEQQKKVIWPTASQQVKARLLMAMGAALLGLSEEKRAAEHFLEAVQYAPDDEKTLTNAAVGYMLLGDLPNAQRYAQSVVERNPTNYNARSVAIQASGQSVAAILADLPSYCRDNRDVAFALGAVAGRQNELEQAEQWYRIALDKSTDVQPEIKGALAQVALHRMLEDKSSLLPLGQINDELRARLQEVERLLSEAWADMPEDSARRPRLAWIVNRGIVRRLIGKTDEARSDFEEALRLNAGHPVAKYFSAVLAEERDDPKAALALAEPIGASAEIPQLPLFVADLVLRVRGHDAAIQYVTDAIKGGLPAALARAAELFIVKALESKQDFQNAIARCEKILESDPGDVRLLVTASRLWRKQQKNDVADAMIAKAQQCVSVSTPSSHLMLLADELYALKRFDDAAAVYERIVVPSLDTWLTYRFLNTCFQAGELTKALDVCNRLKEANGPIQYVAEVESAIYEEIGDLAASCKACDDYLELHPDDGPMQVRRAVVHLRQRDNEAIDAFLAAPPAWESLPLNCAIQIANLLAVRERYKEATQLLYRIRRKHPVGQVHLRYIHSFLFHGQERHDWLEADEVAADTAVCVQDEPEHRQWFVLENSDDANIELSELPTGHRLRQELLGKKVGDRILLRDNVLSPEYGQIVEIQSKYVHAFQQCGETLQTHYPEVKGFEVHHFPKDEGGEASVKKILEQVGRQHDAHRQALQIYKDNLMPIGAFGHFVGLDVFEAWSTLVNDQGSRLHCCVGAPDERRLAFDELARSPRPTLVIDPVALMTITSIGIRDDIVRIVGRLGIAQATIDLLSEMLHRRKAVNRGGFMGLAKEGDIFVRREVTAEQVEQGVAWLDEVLQWIAANCDVLPVPLSHGGNRSSRKQLSEVLGDESVDTILVATDEGRLLYSDDLALRVLAKGDYATEGVWTQLVLLKGVKEKTIDSDKAVRATITLACGGYKHTTIDGQVLLAAARKAEWRVATPYEQVVELLSGEDCDENSAIRVAVDFLYELWKSSVLPQHFDFLTLRLLDALARRRRMRPLIDKLVARTRIRFALIPTAEQQVLRLLQAWGTMRIA